MSIEFSPAFDNLERASLPSRISQLEVAWASRPSETDTENEPGQAAEAADHSKPNSNSEPIRNSKPISPRRLAANRRNAQRSTGPRTPAGKKRSSQNAIKHGLCAHLEVRLPGECEATYNLFIDELRGDLKPKTIADICTFNQLCTVLWRLERMPQSQRDIFQVELDRCAGGETLAASEILARRFSEDPSNNGFLLMDRYERSLRNQYLRLLNQLLKMQRDRVHEERDLVRWRRTVSTTGSNNDPDAERAWTPEKQAAQEAWFKTPEGQEELRETHARNKRQREERDREEHEFAERQRQLRIQEQEQKERELRNRKQREQEQEEQDQQRDQRRKARQKRRAQLQREQKQRKQEARKQLGTSRDQRSAPDSLDVSIDPNRRVPLQRDALDARDALPQLTPKTNPTEPKERSAIESETHIFRSPKDPPGAERSHRPDPASVSPVAGAPG